MPDESGKLTDSDKQSIAKILTEKKAVLACPSCGNPTWSIADNLVMHSLFVNGGTMLGSGFPSVLTVCTNCAFFRFHSAMVFNLAKPDTPTAKPVATEEAKHGA